LIYLLRILMEQNRLPELPIFLDSPMASDATNIYCAHASEHDLSEGQLQGGALCGQNVRFARSVDESKHINGVPGPAIIIASSGMMTGGRILHHLKQRLPDPKNTLVLAGYQAEGTRGRQIQDGAKFIRIHGQDVAVRAAIAQISALSGHAGHDELLRWLKPLAAPKQVFITHGELASATHFAEELRATRGWNTVVPKQGQTFELTR
jgi:metallo-beta-lactamase family protein